MSPENIETKKRRSTSIPLIVGLLILGGVGYVFGEKIMTYVFYLQESMIAASNSKGGDIPNAATPQAGGGGDSGVTSGSEVVPPGAPGIEGPGSGAPGGAGPGGGGNMNPEELFAQRDKDSNGKLEGDEISERMRGRLAEVDADQDTAVSKDEFLAAWRNRQSTGSGTQRPASDSAPATDAPATDAPATDAPATDAPATGAPEPKL